MSDNKKANSISCLVISVVGWLVFVGGIVHIRIAPADAGDFSLMVNGAIFIRYVIAGFMIQFISFAYAIWLALQEGSDKLLCVLAIVSSIVYAVAAIAGYFTGWLFIFVVW